MFRLLILRYDSVIMTSVQFREGALPQATSFSVADPEPQALRSGWQKLYSGAGVMYPTRPDCLVLIC
ncbi:hypothetical protein MiSe_11550 [Microseira wollei NIES-4236]|uniref:Uncharacterized protein n=1 Tax=Microseira wollei NIES-4236 TaxID=2530354 RepID=A0AAV3X7U0_9CYAN|nr:hypothetical protein MiSe_11550 [Microseira wollei NIES-4236]